MDYDPTACNFYPDPGFGSKKRRGKENVNALRSRIIALQEDNEMLHFEVCRLREELAGLKKQPTTGSRVAKHV